ncbi:MULTISPECIES: hypothetical protein [Sphingomonas]|uniref:Uncharacterized protein n=1 Tax=Sphingomonas molluscorum TaxID=418184 RepID=A0ABU8Q7I4_9SPHN|nr:hypothetical protein [Sphingomonas sp. JUb134]MBM7407040.1 hypothetical protein [Sphingomonas sp. JUb134]
MGTDIDAHLVGYAQGLLQDGVRVWVARLGIKENLRIHGIHIADDTKAVFLELDGGHRMMMAPGQLGSIFADAPGR